MSNTWVTNGPADFSLLTEATACKRCKRPLNGAYCSNEACGYSDHKQSCPAGADANNDAKCNCGYGNGTVNESRKPKRGING